VRFALANNERITAAPKLKALCPGCSQPVVAKCGQQKIWHWAHQTKKTCDRWWEPETEWHRAWKDNFPHEWQEVIHHDPSGEKHIADVKTKHGLVIEFQHSPLDEQERAARERFYGNMVWVVDGSRLKKDYRRFRKGIEQAKIIGDGYCLLHFPYECFPASWLASTALVFFDFRAVEPIDPSDVMHQPLWCVLPRRAESKAVVAMTTHRDFVEKASSLPQLLEGHDALVKAIEKNIHERHRQEMRAYSGWSRRAIPRRRTARF
jgi:hypothetical protein